MYGATDLPGNSRPPDFPVSPAIIVYRIRYTGSVANLTIYLPDEVEQQVREAASASNVSVSKWVAERLSRSVETSLPTEFLALAGAFPDFPDLEELRRGYGEDVPRESLD